LGNEPKIIIEIVPWVDSKLSRGWNQDNKKAIIALCKTSDLVKKMLHPDDFVFVCWKNSKINTSSKNMKNYWQQKKPKHLKILGTLVLPKNL